MNKLFSLMYVAAFLMGTFPLLAAANQAPATPSKTKTAAKTADDIEIIVESDKLCNPQEEATMPLYY